MLEMRETPFPLTVIHFHSVVFINTAFLKTCELPVHLLRVRALLPPPSTVFEEWALPLAKQVLHDNTPTFFVSQVPSSILKVLMKAPGPQPCFGLHVKVILYADHLFACKTDWDDETVEFSNSTVSGPVHLPLSYTQTLKSSFFSSSLLDVIYHTQQSANWHCQLSARSMNSLGNVFDALPHLRK